MLKQIAGALGIGRPKPTSSYMRGGASPFFWNWAPALRDPRTEVSASWSKAAARAIDSMHNSGWLAGGVEQAVSSTVGTGLRLNAMPDTAVLGWTADEGASWARDVEHRWEMWSKRPNECDAAGQHSIAQLAGMALREWFATGEVLATVPTLRRSDAVSMTKVQLMPSSRIVNKTLGEGLIQGVRRDRNGRAQGYLLHVNEHPSGMLREVEAPARDSAGRPLVIHIFDGRAGQVRGITPMAPALRVVRQFDQLSDATLTATLIQAIFAATVESEAPTDQILAALQSTDEQGLVSGLDGYLDAKSGWYKNTRIDLGNAGRIAHLFPGERLQFHGSQHPNDTYDAFARFLLREIARCLGITFEQLTGDYTGATYSSVRMATSEAWHVVQYRREHIVGRFLQLVYEAWLEEEIATGRVAFPGGLLGFLEKRAAVVCALWRGGAKPQADDLKTAKAHETYKRMGVLTDEQICADLGTDWEDVYEQRERERKERERRGLPETDTMQPAVDDDADALLEEDAA